MRLCLKQLISCLEALKSALKYKLAKNPEISLHLDADQDIVIQK
jgi:hypothetical protein